MNTKKSQKKITKEKETETERLPMHVDIYYLFKLKIPLFLGYPSFFRLFTLTKEDASQQQLAMVKDRRTPGHPKTDVFINDRCKFKFFADQIVKLNSDGRETELGISILLTAVFSIIFSFVCFFLSLHENLGVYKVMDIQRLIHKQSQQLAKEFSSQKLGLKRVGEPLEALQAFLEVCNQAHQNLLFIKNTVWGGGVKKRVSEVVFFCKTNFI